MMKLLVFLLVFVNQNNLELKEELDILENTLIHWDERIDTTLISSPAYLGFQGSYVQILVSVQKLKFNLKNPEKYAHLHSFANS